MLKQPYSLFYIESTLHFDPWILVLLYTKLCLFFETLASCSDRALERMDVRIKLGEIEDAMKEEIEQFKEIITKVVPQVVEAKVIMVLHSMWEPTCMTIRP